MSQADSRNITNPSRRGLLASVPAAALILSPALANALGELPASVAGPVDPILQLIAAHRASIDACHAVSGQEYEDDKEESRAWRAASKHSDDCLVALLTTQPQTLFGLARLFDHLGTRQWDDPMEPDIYVGAHNVSRQDVSDAANGWFAIVSATVDRFSGSKVSSNPPAEPDPIFAVIAEHGAANLAFYEACHANHLDVEECPVKARAEDRQMAAELLLFTTAPATVLGAAALLEYLESPAAGIGIEVDGDGDTIMSWSRNWLIPDLAAAVRRFPSHLAAALRNIVAGGAA